MKNVKIKLDTPEAQPHVITEFDKTPKSCINVLRTSAKKYNTRSITKIVNHVTTFNNTPKLFPVEAT